jgi:hypothetical protein
VLGAWGASQRKKGKGKAKAGSSGAGGGPSTKKAAAAGSSGQGSSRPSAPPARIIGLSTEQPAVQVAEAPDGAQLTEPQPAGGSTKQDKERLRKERQRHRKLEEARETLYGAIALLEEAAGSVEAVEEAMQVAVKHESRCDRLTALMDVARTLVKQARAAEEAAAEAAEAEPAAERLQMEEDLSALALSA